MWCGDCYKADPLDKFHVAKPEDENGYCWIKKGDENRFDVGRNGDHLMTPFQCDLCVGRTLTGRDLEDNPSDRLLSVVIRRMNLDSLWSRERGTVNGNRSTMRRGMQVSQMMGLQPPYVPLGPYPLEDVMGYGVAAQFLVASLADGAKGRDYCQFETIRKYQSAFSNAFNASAQGIAEPTTSGNKKLHVKITRCPMESEWFGRFSKGCRSRMGQDSRPDKAISIPVFHELMNELEVAAKAAATPEEFALYISVGTYSVISFCGSLRGNEGFMTDLGGLRLHRSKGRVGRDDPHVAVTLLGRFKGETGERLHLIPLPNVTRSGIRCRFWIEGLLRVREKEGRVRGPAFCDANGEVALSKDYELVFQDMLSRVQARCPDLIPPEVDVYEDYGISRSFRRGSTTEARNQGVAEADINLINRWRSVESAAGRRPNLVMQDSYSDIILMIPSLLRYPQAL